MTTSLEPLTLGGSYRRRLRWIREAISLLRQLDDLCVCLADANHDDPAWPVIYQEACRLAQASRRACRRAKMSTSGPVPIPGRRGSWQPALTPFAYWPQAVPFV